LPNGRKRKIGAFCLRAWKGKAKNTTEKALREMIYRVLGKRPLHLEVLSRAEATTVIVVLKKNERLKDVVS